jgi:hypothetical protein
MVAVRFSSPLPTELPEADEQDLTPTDASWSWLGWQAADDSIWEVSGTPLPLEFHAGSLVRKAVTDVCDVWFVFDVASSPTVTGAAGEGIVGGYLAQDLASTLRRLFGTRLRKQQRRLCQRTSTRIDELVPILGFREHREQTVQAPEPSASARDAIEAGRELHAGLRAIDDLRRWLSVSVTEVARITGLSESTIYWWAAHPTSIPRPAKVDQLLGLQALVWGLVDDLGEAGTRTWFRAGRPSPLDRLRGDPGTLPIVEEEGYKLLMRRANERLAAAGPGKPVTDDDDQRDLARLAEQERHLKEPLTVEALDPSRLEPDDRG